MEDTLKKKNTQGNLNLKSSLEQATYGQMGWFSIIMLSKVCVTYTFLYHLKMQPKKSRKTFLLSQNYDGMKVMVPVYPYFPYQVAIQGAAFKSNFNRWCFRLNEIFSSSYNLIVANELQYRKLCKLHLKILIVWYYFTFKHVNSNGCSQLYFI